MVGQSKLNDMQKGTIILVHGFVMLKGLDGGNYYYVTDVDDRSITFAKTGKRGLPPRLTAKRIRHRKWDILGCIEYHNRGDKNGIEIIKNEI